MQSLRVGVCLKAESNPFWSIDVRKGLEEVAKEHRDVRLLYNSPACITDFLGQQKIIRNFIRQKVDVIILAPSEPIKLITSVKEINKANIPLIIIDSRLNEKELVSQKVRYDVFIGFDDY